MNITDYYKTELKVQDKVIWLDPDKSARDLKRVWTIDAIVSEELIRISDENSESEVLPSELVKYVPMEEFVNDLDYVYVEDTQLKYADDVENEIREFIRNHGFDCIGDDTIDDYEEYMADEHPDVDTSEYEECAVASPEFLCENKYNWEHDVDWVEFQISFYGIWCKEGVFFVSH
jgi:hypothetical protein